MSSTLSDKAASIGRARQRQRAPAPLSRRRNRTALMFLLPGGLLFALYVIYPVISSISLSFYNWDGMTAKAFIGLDNYRELFHSDTFYTALKNNVIWLVLFLLAPPFGLAFALYLNQTVRGIRLMKSLFFAPFVLPGVVVGLVFGWFYDPTFGLLKLIVGHGIPVLGDPRYVTYGIIFAALWPQIPFCMILYLTGLTGINSEIIEAARMEGAQGFALLWHVILPQLRPATFMAVRADRDRRATQLRPDLGDERRRSIRQLDCAGLFHVRPGDQVLPRRVFRCDCSGAVRDHADLYRLAVAAARAQRNLRNRHVSDARFPLAAR